MSALGHKWTFAVQNGMSALPPESGHSERCGESGGLHTRIDLGAERSKIDRLGEKLFRAALQCLALGLRIAIGSDHNDPHIVSSRFGFGQQFKSGHPWHIDVRQDQDY